MSDRPSQRLHIRAVPADVIDVLRGRAQSRGTTLAAYLRDALTRLAEQPEAPRTP